MKPHTRPPRILVADDHEFVRVGIISVLKESHPEWRIVGEARNGREASDLADALRPDVAIVDLCMPEMDGLGVTRHLCSTISGIRVVILSAHTAQPVVLKLRNAGASAVLSKFDAASQIAIVLERLLSGGRFFASESASQPRSELRVDECVPVQSLLTPRELDVFRLLAEGWSSKAAAWHLGLGVRTIESHRARINKHLGTAAPGALARMAIRDGIIKTVDVPSVIT